MEVLHTLSEAIMTLIALATIALVAVIFIYNIKIRRCKHDIYVKKKKAWYCVNCNHLLKD